MSQKAPHTATQTQSLLKDGVIIIIYLNITINCTIVEVVLS